MPENLDEIFCAITQPTKLWSRADVLSKPSPVLKVAGIYAWYFKEIPPGVPIDRCYSSLGSTLLYVGISPARKPENGKQNKQTICSRIRMHYRGNAYGSTLRLSLGCLLSDKLGISLQPASNKGRLTFGKGEDALSLWLSENAFVVWYAVENPWTVEEEIIRRLNVPLNLENNQQHPFHAVLSAIRKKCKQAARFP